MSDISIPGFDIIELIGRGGMADVWKARQVSLDREVAIKVLSSDFSSEAADVERFQEEARAAARLKHSGIVQVYDASTADGLYFFVMEYVAGYTVGKWLRRKGVLPEVDALVVAECVADALEYAWAQAGIIHCDIKPDNVIVDADGTVKVADLGLARTINAMSRSAEASDEVMGTPSYISPEQAMGAPDLDWRADVYSLGAMLYHLVTGRRPFEGHPDGDVLELQCTGQLESPLNVQPEVSVPMCMLIEKMMARKPEHRHADWGEVKSDISRVKRGHPPRHVLAAEAESTVARSPQTQRYRRPDAVHSNLERWKKRDRSSMLATWIVAGVFLLGLLVWWVSHGRTLQPHMPPPTTVSTRTETPAVSASAREHAVELYGQVSAWIAANPDDYTEGMRRLGAIRPQVAGTEYVARIDRDLLALREKESNARQGVVNELQSKVDAMQASGDYRGAIELLRSYAGPMADATLEWRTRTAGRLRRRAIAVERVESPEAPAPVSPVFDLDQAMDRVVDTLMTAGPSAAALVVRTTGRSDGARAHAEQLSALEKVLLETARVDDRILSTFNDQVGMEITVQLNTGAKTLRVERVAEGRVFGSAMMASSGVVSMPVSFSPSDLFVAERLKRMGDDTQPEVALGKGLLAVRAGALSRAIDYFAGTHELIAAKLQAAVRKMQKDAASPPVEPPTPAVRAGVGATDRSGGPPPIATLPRELAAVRDDVRAVRNLLLEENPQMEPHELRITEADGKATGVWISSPQLEDIESLAALTTLKSFYVSPRGGASCPLRSIDALAGLPLQSVVLERTRVDDLSALRRVPLTSLSVNGSPVRDLGPLRNMQLTDLSLRGTKVLDVSVLGGMPLKALDLGQTGARRLLAVSGMPLESLSVSGCPITELSFLSGLQLRKLDVSDTAVRDLSNVAGMPLSSLDLSRTRITDLSLLADLPLRSLKLAGVSARDFSVLAQLALTVLDVSETGFSDAGLLSGMELENLNLADCDVEDLSALSGQPLTSLSIAGTGVSDIAPLKGAPLTTLDCRGAPVASFTALWGAPIERLSIDNPTHHSGFVRALSELKWLNGVNLYYATDSPFRRVRKP